MEKTQVNCLEKNPAVEKYYSEMSNEQKLAEIEDSLESTCRIFRNLWKERNAVIKELLLETKRQESALIDSHSL